MAELAIPLLGLAGAYLMSNQRKNTRPAAPLAASTGSALAASATAATASATTIAEGYTNRAIGEVLHLSEKTVRNHVSQLLRKLGFQRRSQAAAWAGERRLELPPE